MWKLTVCLGLIQIIQAALEHSNLTTKDDIKHFLQDITNNLNLSDAKTHHFTVKRIMKPTDYVLSYSASGNLKSSFGGTNFTVRDAEPTVLRTEVEPSTFDMESNGSNAEGSAARLFLKGANVEDKPAKIDSVGNFDRSKDSVNHPESLFLQDINTKISNLRKQQNDFKLAYKTLAEGLKQYQNTDTGKTAKVVNNNQNIDTSERLATSFGSLQNKDIYTSNAQFSNAVINKLVRKNNIAGINRYLDKLIETDNNLFNQLNPLRTVNLIDIQSNLSNPNKNTVNEGAQNSTVQFLDYNNVFANILTALRNTSEENGKKSPDLINNTETRLNPGSADNTNSDITFDNAINVKHVEGTTDTNNNEIKPVHENGLDTEWVDLEPVSGEVRKPRQNVKIARTKEANVNLAGQLASLLKDQTIDFANSAFSTTIYKLKQMLQKKQFRNQLNSALDYLQDFFQPAKYVQKLKYQPDTHVLRQNIDFNNNLNMKRKPFETFKNKLKSNVESNAANPTYNKELHKKMQLKNLLNSLASGKKTFSNTIIFNAKNRPKGLEKINNFDDLISELTNSLNSEQAMNTIQQFQNNNASNQFESQDNITQGLTSQNVAPISQNGENLQAFDDANILNSGVKVQTGPFLQEVPTEDNSLKVPQQYDENDKNVEMEQVENTQNLQKELPYYLIQNLLDAQNKERISNFQKGSQTLASQSALNFQNFAKYLQSNNQTQNKGMSLLGSDNVNGGYNLQTSGKTQNSNALVASSFWNSIKNIIHFGTSNTKLEALTTPLATTTLPTTTEAPQSSSTSTPLALTTTEVPSPSYSVDNNYQSFNSFNANNDLKFDVNYDTKKNVVSVRVLEINLALDSLAKLIKDKIQKETHKKTFGENRRILNNVINRNPDNLTIVRRRREAIQELTTQSSLTPQVDNETKARQQLAGSKIQTKHYKYKIIGHAIISKKPIDKKNTPKIVHEKKLPGNLVYKDTKPTGKLVNEVKNQTKTVKSSKIRIKRDTSEAEDIAMAKRIREKIMLSRDSEDFTKRLLTVDGDNEEEVPSNRRIFDNAESTTANNLHDDKRDHVKRKLLAFIDETVSDIKKKVNSIQKLQKFYENDKNFKVGYTMSNIDHLYKSLTGLYEDIEKNKSVWDELAILNVYEQLKESNKTVTDLMSSLINFIKSKATLADTKKATAGDSKIAISYYDDQQY